jgi:ABC-type antimicrobial peptide transport system permease subunit
VVTDVRQERLRLDAPTRMIYTPLAQNTMQGIDPDRWTGEAQPPPRLTAEIVTTGDPRALAASVRDEARALSKDAVVSYVRTMEDQLDHSLVRERVLATLSSAFGLLALLLAGVGLYGVMSYTVARRRREIGIRLALGAARSSVLWRVLRETAALSAIGIAIGLAAAIAASRVVSTFLFGLTPRDPATFAGAATILFLTALAAGYVPARRAAAVDPMHAIRTD